MVKRLSAKKSVERDPKNIKNEWQNYHDNAEQLIILTNNTTETTELLSTQDAQTYKIAYLGFQKQLKAEQKIKLAAEVISWKIKQWIS